MTMPTLFEKLLAAGFPIESASDEEGVHLLPGSELTAAQQIQMGEIILEHQDPSGYADYTEGKTIRQQFKDEYIATITQLEAIENAVNPTNAQVTAAVKYLAKILRLTLKLIIKLFQ